MEAGQTSTLKFVLGDVFAPLRFQVPDKGATSLGDDWKWVLRTSAATRPILRYQQETPATTDAGTPLPADQRLIGVVPGSSGLDPLASDPGMGSVLAYVRHLSPDSDLLAVGSLRPDGILDFFSGDGVSKGLDFSVTLRNFPWSCTNWVTQVAWPLRVARRPAFRFLCAGIGGELHPNPRLYPHLTLTAGMDIDFLDALRDVVIAQPRMKLAYHVHASTDLAVQVGGEPSDDSETLLERVNGSIPSRVLTLRGYRPEFEQLHHSEVSLTTG